MAPHRGTGNRAAGDRRQLVQEPDESALGSVATSASRVPHRRSGRVFPHVDTGGPASEPVGTFLQHRAPLPCDQASTFCWNNDRYLFAAGAIILLNMHGEDATSMNDPLQRANTAADCRAASPSDAAVPAAANLTTDGSEGAYPAFSAIYQQYAPRLFAFFYQHVRHRQDAEDLTATTFSKVLSSIERYTEQGCFEAWLWSIARHTLADAQHRREAIDIERIGLALVDPSPPPEAQVLQAEQVDMVLQLLHGLPADQRQVLLLRFVREWSFHEIACSLGRSIGAVKMLLQRALASLRTRYPQREHVQFDMTPDSVPSARELGMTHKTFRLPDTMVAVMHFAAQLRWRVPQPQPLRRWQPAVVPVRNVEMYVTRRRPG